MECNLYRKAYKFKFNLEIINCTSGFLHKVSKLHEPIGQMQFELFEKLMSANYFPSEREKLYDYYFTLV